MFHPKYYVFTMHMMFSLWILCFHYAYYDFSGNTVFTVNSVFTVNILHLIAWFVYYVFSGWWSDDLYEGKYLELKAKHDRHLGMSRDVSTSNFVDEAGQTWVDNRVPKLFLQVWRERGSEVLALTKQRPLTPPHKTASASKCIFPVWQWR